MIIQKILHDIFSFLPFVVCLFWLVGFLLKYNKSDASRRIFMVYLATCVVLYLCHALFFTIGLPYILECVWTLCSLSVYPLFYGYLCRLTSLDYSVRKMLLWLMPGFVVALAKYLWPDAGIDGARFLLFMCQIVSVCYFGIRKLKAFDLKLQTIYADTEGRDTKAVSHLLIAIIIVSLLSGVANSVGREFFDESLWLLVPISLAFSIMLFSLSYICYYKDFTIDQLTVDEKEGELCADALQHEDAEQIGRKIEALMNERHFFLKKDLKIGDVVKEVGSNRTYVSNYINRTYQCSFSDYMNQHRIEYAKQLMMSSAGSIKLVQIADESGFASEQSFYRNFKKFVNMTPGDWLSSIRESEIS